MSKKTLIELGTSSYFVRKQIQEGNFSSESAVVKAALELFEEKTKIASFIEAMNHGIQSGLNHEFDLKKYQNNEKIDTSKFDEKKMSMELAELIMGNRYVKALKTNSPILGEFTMTKKAIEDLNIIRSNNDEKLKKYSYKYYEYILSCCKNISESPYEGTDYSQFSEGVFGKQMYAVPGRQRKPFYVIYYKIENHNKINIIRILMSRMDIKNYLQSSIRVTT